MATFTSVHPILDSLKKGLWVPVYLLQGEEPFYIDQVVTYVTKKLLPPAHQSLNLHLYYGKEYSLQDILSNARSIPMTGDRKIIIVKEAQEMTELYQVAGQKRLLKYLAQPTRTTLLLFVCKHKPVRSSKVLQALAKNGHVLLNVRKVYERQLPVFIQEQVKLAGYTITSTATNALHALIGVDLQRIANELRKITANLPQGKTITEEEINKHVNMQRRYTIFDLQRAIGQQDCSRTLRIVNYLANHPKQYPASRVVRFLTHYFLKLLHLHQLQKQGHVQPAAVLGLHPGFLREYQIAVRSYSVATIEYFLELLHQADLQLKGVDTASVTDQAVLRELIGLFWITP